MIHLTNSLTKKKELFTPITPGKIGLYSCGPTVYDYIHIGNLRAFLLSDIVRRAFEFNGFEVRQVMNITDIGHLASDNDEGDDKMTKGLRREGKPITLGAMRELADFYAARFKENLTALNILSPNEMPHASDHIADDIALVQKLEKKGFTYKTDDGIYFDTSKDPKYGALAGVNAQKSNDDQARIKENVQKHDLRDFALWKFNPAIGYDSPWGKGFPGWHIECSAMSERYLGEHFDIHTGGIDLAPIHHNNEIAQSESAHGHTFVNYWLHNAFVNLESGKMAKSAGTGITLASVTERGIDPLAYRYWLLGGHYRTPMAFSWEALEAVGTAYGRLLGHMSEWRQSLSDEEKSKESSTISQKYLDLFTQAVNDDLNTPEALALVWNIVADKELSPASKWATVKKFDTVLGLKLDEHKMVTVPDEVSRLVAEREQARAEKRWNDADMIRDKIHTHGFDVKDTAAGPVIERL